MSTIPTEITAATEGSLDIAEMGKRFVDGCKDEWNVWLWRCRYAVKLCS